jgi:hypothetical protein
MWMHSHSEAVVELLPSLWGNGLAQELRRQNHSMIGAEEIDQVTAADRRRRDTIHLVVMDAHKAINRMQLDLAESTVDGARIYGLALGDDALVQAFMGGLNRAAQVPAPGTRHNRHACGRTVDDRE